MILLRIRGVNRRGEIEDVGDGAFRLDGFLGVIFAAEPHQRAVAAVEVVRHRAALLRHEIRQFRAGAAVGILAAAVNDHQQILQFAELSDGAARFIRKDVVLVLVVVRDFADIAVDDQRRAEVEYVRERQRVRGKQRL